MITTIAEISESSIARPGAFRFLELPAEVRLMVYSYLCVRTIRRPFLGNAQELKGVIVRDALPIQLLVTCKLVNREASGVLGPRLAVLRKSTTLPRLSITTSPYTFLKLRKTRIPRNAHSLLLALRDWLSVLQSSNNSDFHEWALYQDIIPNRKGGNNESLFNFIRQAGINMMNLRGEADTNQSSVHPLLLSKWSRTEFSQTKYWSNSLLCEPLRLNMIICREHSTKSEVMFETSVVDNKWSMSKP